MILNSRVYTLGAHRAEPVGADEAVVVAAAPFLHPSGLRLRGSRVGPGEGAGGLIGRPQ